MIQVERTLMMLLNLAEHGNSVTGRAKLRPEHHPEVAKHFNDLSSLAVPFTTCIVTCVDFYRRADRDSHVCA